MTTITSIMMIYKLLDLLHDYVLCPVFGDKQQHTQDYDKILAKLDQIESIIIQMRDKGGKNGNSNT